jgi:hypothetical protein
MWGFVFADRRAKEAKIANIFPTIRNPGKTAKNKKQQKQTYKNEKQNKTKNKTNIKTKNTKKQNNKKTREEAGTPGAPRTNRTRQQPTSNK